ncbi:hypothetical protein Tco_0790228 [Tanacetum coccineum]
MLISESSLAIRHYRYIAWLIGLPVIASSGRGWSSMGASSSEGTKYSGYSGSRVPGILIRGWWSMAAMGSPSTLDANTVTPPNEVSRGNMALAIQCYFIDSIAP